MFTQKNVPDVFRGITPVFIFESQLFLDFFTRFIFDTSVN